MIGFTAKALSAWLDFIISKIKAGITSIDETGEIPLTRNKTKENESELWGKCILEFRIFSVVQVSHSHLWKGLFTIGLPECCLSTLLWVPDQHLVYSSVGNHPAEKEKHLDKTSGDSGRQMVLVPRSYPLVIPIGVIPWCVELSGSVTRVWSVGKGRAIAVIATWQQEETLDLGSSQHLKCN